MFMECENVLLKVSPIKCVIRFGKKGKLSMRFIGQFGVLERVREVAYRLAFLLLYRGIFCISSIHASKVQ